MSRLRRQEERRTCIPRSASERSSVAMTSLDTMGRQSEAEWVARAESASYADVRAFASLVGLCRHNTDQPTALESYERDVPFGQPEQSRHERIVVTAERRRIG